MTSCQWLDGEQLKGQFVFFDQLLFSRTIYHLFRPALLVFVILHFLESSCAYFYPHILKVSYNRFLITESHHSQSAEAHQLRHHLSS